VLGVGGIEYESREGKKGEGVALLDVRGADEFRRGHAEDAASIPWEELGERTSELPASREAPLLVWDSDPTRAEAAAAHLRSRGYVRAAVAPAHRGAPARLASGGAGVRLWSANPFLLACLPSLVEALRGGGAIDLACGSGREAVVLAEAGFRVLAFDHLPDALARAQALAGHVGVRIETRSADLEAPGFTLPEGSASLVTCFRFLWRPLFVAIARGLRSGGLLCAQTFDVRERARTGRPRSDRHLLQPGELVSLSEAAGLEVVRAEEGPGPGGRILQGVLARRR